MSKEWYTELEDKYIHLFETYEDGRVVRGIEVSKGWAKITEQLLEKFEWIRTHNTFVENPYYLESEKSSKDNPRYIEGFPHDIKIFQIKQKFGSFECYAQVRSGSETAQRQVDEAIAYAQGQARLTCESCGKVGNSDGSVPDFTEVWISVICDRCLTI